MQTLDHRGNIYLLLYLKHTETISIYKIYDNFEILKLNPNHKPCYHAFKDDIDYS